MFFEILNNVIREKHRQPKTLRTNGPNNTSKLNNVTEAIFQTSRKRIKYLLLLKQEASIWGKCVSVINKAKTTFWFSFSVWGVLWTPDWTEGRQLSLKHLSPLCVIKWIQFPSTISITIKLQHNVITNCNIIVAHKKWCFQNLLNSQVFVSPTMGWWEI